MLGCLVPLEADLLPGDLVASAILPGTRPEFCSDRVMPLEDAALRCSDDNGTTIPEPCSCRAGDTVAGPWPPDVVSLVDGRSAGLLPCLEQFVHTHNL